MGRLKAHSRGAENGPCSRAGWRGVDATAVKGTCEFECEQRDGGLCRLRGPEEGGEKQGFMLTSVEMLKNGLSRRVPVWGLAGLERERAGSMGWGGAEAGRSGVAVQCGI